MGNADEELARIKSEIEGNNPSPSVSVRTFLGWFGAQRRGYWIVQDIRQQLAKANLETKPDFEGAYIDSQITFRAIPPTPPPTLFVEVASIPSTEAVGVPAVEVVAPLVGGSPDDPTYLIGKLEAANQLPASVGPDAELGEAVTRMMMDDLTVIAVMQSPRSIRGAVTWRSIAERLALGHAAGPVRDFMEQPDKVEADRSLFAAIPTIVERGYVFVMEHSALKGVVTSRDLSLQFKALSEPFLLLSEIEKQIRRLIAAKFTEAELREVRDPSDTSRDVKKVADLAFGEYVRLLQKPDRWTKVGLALDRAQFVARLEDIRRIRNDVMHIDPDGVTEADLGTLRAFARFLREMPQAAVVRA